jgi:hypothetical protein
MPAVCCHHATTCRVNATGCRGQRAGAGSAIGDLDGMQDATSQHERLIMHSDALSTLEHDLPRVVTGWKIRDHGRALTPTAQADFTGVLYHAPRVGRPMTVYRLEDAVITSRVRDVSLGPEGAVWVETMNSTYRLVVGPGRRMHEAA